MEEDTYNPTFIQEKNKQDSLVFQKVNPKNRNLVYDIILKYDLEHSTTRVTIKPYNSYQEFRNAVQKYLIDRQVYLNEMTSSL